MVLFPGQWHTYYPYVQTGWNEYYIGFEGVVSGWMSSARVGGWKRQYYSDIDLVVYTAAIRDTNPELSAARAAGIPTITRAELLGQIMTNYKTAVNIAGTHGKTTTTSMLTEVFRAVSCG